MLKVLRYSLIAFATSLSINALAQSSTNVTVDLDTPGNLGVEILYQADQLSDVTGLTVIGEINSTDWQTIQKLVNIRILDLSQAKTDNIPASAFENRSSLTDISLCEGISTIGNRAFYNTSNLKNIEFPASVTSLGNDVFNHSGIETVIFRENSQLNSLGSSAFYECNSLTSVRMQKNSPLSSIPNDAFYNCNALNDITLPDKVTAINSSSFRNCSSLAELEFPASLTSLGSYAFYSSGLVSVTLPEGFNDIQNNSFSNCKSLEEITLPSTLHSIGNYVFTNCSSLNKLTCSAVFPPSTQQSSFNSIENISLIVPEFSVAQYKLASPWLNAKEITGGAVSSLYDINDLFSLTGTRRMDNTPSVTIQPGGGLQISGNLPQALNSLIINNNYSGNNYNYSQFINGSPATSAQETVLTYNLPSYAWRFISLPFDVKADEIYTNNSALFVVRYYDGAARAAANNTGNSWKDVEPGTLIEAGTGIIVQANNSCTLVFPAADDCQKTLFNPNEVTIELELNTAESSAHAGWNFVANPYHCCYDMYYAMLECPITVYNHNNNTYSAYSLIDDDIVLAPSQPFFIQAAEEVSQITFSTQGRQFANSPSRPNAVKARSASQERFLFDAVLEMGSMSDKTRVVVNKLASEDYEISRDASKFLSENTSMPQLYTIDSTGAYLAINERPAGDVKLGFYAPQACEMSICFARADGKATLFDALLQKSITLSDGESYIFDSEAGYCNDRFSINVAEAETMGVNDLSNSGTANVIVNGNTIHVVNAGGADITICNIEGAVFVYETVADNATYQLPAGFYVVKVADKSFKTIIK